MNVLIVVDHAVGRSGPHRNVVGSLNGLAHRDDVNLRLLCNGVDDTEPYVRCGRVDIQLGFNPHDARAAVTNIVHLRRALQGVDVLYVPTGLKSFLYAWALKGKRPLVAGPNVSGIPGLMDPVNPSPVMTMHMADAWIEMSEVRAYYCEKAGTPRSHIHLVPHALDLDRFNPANADREVWQKEGLDPRRFKLLYVGHSREKKGVRQLLDASQLLREEGLDVDLVLVGERGKQFRSDDLASPRVFFLGPRYGNRLTRLYASADVFVGASCWETWWFTPMEAMASGTPVVVSPVGAIPELIPEDGVQGRLVDVVDPATGKHRSDAAHRLAKVIKEVVTDECGRAQMAVAGRRHLETYFTEAHQSERLRAVFAHALVTA